MRLWSIHPLYLDSRGFVALWRETLLARDVLRGKTSGYRHHPQLQRFQESPSPLEAIEVYLWGIFDESTKRNYHFNESKLSCRSVSVRLRVTTGQLDYEKSHLLKKLKQRDFTRYENLTAVEIFQVHPLFEVVGGNVAAWEKVE